MSTIQLRDLITKEIEKLNDRIDKRIIQGKPYKKFSRHHKMLLRELNHISRRNVSNHAYANF